MTLPKFTELHSKYSATEVRAPLKAVIEELNHEVPGTKLPGLGKDVPNPDPKLAIKAGDTGPRYKAMIADIKKRADHTGLHGLKHGLKLHSGDVAEEVLLFVVDQAILISELSGGIHLKLRSLAGGDPGSPEHDGLLLKGENGVARRAVGSAGDASKKAVDKILSDSPPEAPKGQPSAHDLLYYSSLTYQNLDKALWHTFRARKARRILAAYLKTEGKTLKHCADAALASFLLQTYMHHLHKARIYASPMVALVEFCSHWCAEWGKAWRGSGEDDAEALNNLQTVYDTIFALNVTHKEWDCVKNAGLCYGPDDDPKKGMQPKKPLGAAASGKTLFEDVSHWEDLKKYALEKKINAGKKLSTAGVTVANFFKKGVFKAKVFYEEGLEPLFKDEEFLKEADVRIKDDSVRDQDNAEDIIAETKLQYERFAAWVLGDAANHDWTKDDKTIKRLRRKMVAGLHSDEKHEANPPYHVLFKDKLPDGLFARMQYDIYGLVEARDFGKNVKNAWKKFWAPKKKGEIGVTLFFIAAGVAVAIGTAGVGLPVVALIGLAAAKKVAQKAALKGIKKANAKLNTAALKGKEKDGKTDSPDNEQLTLTATQARESAQSMARHFVSSFKNFQRMSELKEANKANKGKKFYWDNCGSAVGYAYAAYAFDHHYTKTVARLQSLTALSDALLGALAECETDSDACLDLMDRATAVVKRKVDDHVKTCDGRTDGKSRMAASRGSPTYISQNFPSCICYAPNEHNPTNETSGSPYAMFSPSRGLFHMDYVLKKEGTYPPYDMLEHWVNFRDVHLAALKKEVKAVVEEEKKKAKQGLAKDKADQDALAQEMGENQDDLADLE
jgi:hypothetical protein